MLIVLMVSVIIFINYNDGSGHVLYRSYGSWQFAFIHYYLLFFIPFALAFFLQALFFSDRSYFSNKWFWIILLMAPAIFSFRVNAQFYVPIIKKFLTGDSLLFWIRCTRWFAGLFLVIIPVFIIWNIKDKHDQPFYGSKKLDRIRPYVLMIACMIPLIALASMQVDFSRMYPRAKLVAGLDIYPKFLYYFLHELFYSLDFITIEVFFRGFLILSLAKICGQQCILPAACFYCCIHLGKPMGEAISSFGGGLLLGIISYNTKSIRGGLIVHIGIAWLMEVAGFVINF